MNLELKLESSDDRIIAQALEVLERRFRRPSAKALDCPEAVKAYARLKLAGLDREVFMVIFTDCASRPIAVEQLFQGTLTQTSVYPREVVRAALRHNAARCFLIHNHPSGVAEFSAADERLTEQLRETLRMVGVQVLDHFVVAGAECASYESLGARREAQRELDAGIVRCERQARQSEAAKKAWARRKLNDRSRPTP